MRRDVGAGDLRRGCGGPLPARCAAFAASAALLLAVSGCASLFTSAAGGFAANLSDAILNQDDPDLVREGTPAYLLMLDAMVQSAPREPDILGAAAELYAAYGVAFVDDAPRAQRLTARARDYGRRSICAADRRTCGIEGVPYEQFAEIVGGIRPRAAGPLYSYAVASLAFIRANSADWTALAELPKVERALERLVEIGPAERAGNVNAFLGILNTLRPPALGGDPERGRRYFESALAMTEGKDLSVKVEFARGYARLVYDRELHDRLLKEVLAAPVESPGLTLFNSLAKRQAEELLASADAYF